MKSYFVSAVLILTLSAPVKKQDAKQAKPDLVVKATQFRLANEYGKIFFKVELTNIGNAPCNINGTFDIRTSLSTDDIIGNDQVSGGRAIPVSFILEPGKVRLLNDEFFLSFNELENLQNNPYCVIEIHSIHPNLESNYENNKSIYKHGFPRKKGEGVSKPIGDLPVKQAERFVDLQLSVSNVVREIKTDVAGKQYKEYTYDAILKNIGNTDAVIDLDKPVTLQYRRVVSCQDTTGDNAVARPQNPNLAYIIKPGTSIVLYGRKAMQAVDATTALLIEMLFAGTERNLHNNIACIPN
ncbi:hypothetical protein CAP36_08420 [Chitinophagaceae bacterium IBVUCB2]|nr:hypothetical protein CAP36_08420 [Chitinophagaceae bacterium IBVUCB2]